MPSSRSYAIIEPHPSLNTQSAIMTGRGGAGNFSRSHPSLTRGSDASGPPSHFSSLPAHSSTANSGFMTGRGGAGNVQRYPAERAMFSFDEELNREMQREGKRAPVYHVGRGGAGNAFGRSAKTNGAGVDVYAKSERKYSDDSASAKSQGSDRSAESGAEVATRKIKGWGKRVVGVH